MCICWGNARWHGRQDKVTQASTLARRKPETRATYSCTSAQSIPMMRFSAKRFSDFGKIRYRASLLSLKPAIPKSIPLSLFRIVITRAFFICAWRCRSAERLLPQGVNLRTTALLDYLGEARCFDLEKFHCESLDRCRSDAADQKRSPPENYGKEDQTTVAAFLPWRDL